MNRWSRLRWEPSKDLGKPVCEAGAGAHSGTMGLLFSPQLSALPSAHPLGELLVSSCSPQGGGSDVQPCGVWHITKWSSVSISPSCRF